MRCTYRCRYTLHMFTDADLATQGLNTPAAELEAKGIPFHIEGVGGNCLVLIVERPEVTRVLSYESGLYLVGGYSPGEWDASGEPCEWTEVSDPTEAVAALVA